MSKIYSNMLQVSKGKISNTSVINAVGDMSLKAGASKEKFYTLCNEYIIKMPLTQEQIEFIEKEKEEY